MKAELACPRCGAELVDDVPACSSCGLPFSGAGSADLTAITAEREAMVARATGSERSAKPGTDTSASSPESRKSDATDEPTPPTGDDPGERPTSKVLGSLARKAGIVDPVASASEVDGGDRSFDLHTDGADAAGAADDESVDESEALSTPKVAAVTSGRSLPSSDGKTKEPARRSRSGRRRSSSLEGLRDAAEADEDEDGESTDPFDDELGTEGDDPGAARTRWIGGLMVALIVVQMCGAGLVVWATHEDKGIGIVAPGLALMLVASIVAIIGQGRRFRRSTDDVD
jgi:hypothetical protein